MSNEKPKFTPGPWYIKPRTVKKFKYDTFVSRTTVLNAPDGGYSPRHVIATVARGNGKEVENAALIAAAPEMYEMLNIVLSNLLHGIHKSSIGVVTQQRIEVLLAKARGENAE